MSSTTTNFTTDTNLFYGKRYCNGRAWVEVLAQRQGLGANTTTNYNWAYNANNLSFFGHYSPLMVSNVLKFTAPANASNCLFVVWVCDADFVGDLYDNAICNPAVAPNNGTNLAAWTAAINQHLTNHFRAFTNLYAKGMRTLLAPNAVDVTKAPAFAGYFAPSRAFVRQRIISFNTNYVALLNQVQAASPGLKIYMPDMFGIFDAGLTNSAAYGLTNAVFNGGSADAINAYYNYGMLSSIALNGPGTNYVFWEQASPTARMNELFADVAQQALSPVQLTGMAQTDISNRLDVANLPVGLNGIVLYATNLMQNVWLTNSTFSSLTVTQSVFIYPTNSSRFYSLKFPYAWTWP
ncbi:MAG: hypothetical protein JF609_06855 [Verrucomicrobia bacterium]|nr:hypothetical protein [Verrucomicrobiota bacterium]